LSKLLLAGGVARTSARRARRSIAVAAGAVTAAMLALSAPALAGVGTFGPVDPDHGFPTWYDDGNGGKVALCLDGPPMCLAGVPNSSNPAAVPDNFEDEAFWWTAEAAIDEGGVNALLVLAQEAAFANGAPATGDQMTFGRVRIRISGLQAGGRYTVTHPYGEATFTAEAGTGPNINDTQDVGCVPVAVAGQFCDFSLTRFSALGPPFLRWDPAESPPPAGFLGDPNVEHTVVGSPNNTNFFRITGPGLPLAGLRTDRFSVQAKLAGPETAFSDARPRSLSFGSATVGTPTAPQTVTVHNGGTVPMTISSISLAGATSGDFALSANTCAGATLQSGGACSVAVALAPGSPGAKSATLTVADDAAGGLRTVALSGDAVAAPAPVAPPAAPAAPAVAAVPAIGVAGTQNRAQPVTRLVVRRTVTRARLRRDGLRVTANVPAGVRYVRISVFRVNGNRRASRPIWVEIRRVRRAGAYRAVLGSRRLIRRLRPGTYQVEIRTGRTRATRGRPVTTRFRVSR
jgi:Abnormal spindle-like microcephaly-assoc'd, ASPM-SPD-2-Hydin